MPSPIRFSVRRAREKDLLLVCELELRVWKEMSATEDVLRHRFLQFAEGFQLAWAGVDLAGFCCASISDQDASEAELDEAYPPAHVPRGGCFFIFGLTVSPLYRRKGIGRALVRRQLSVARKKGCRKAQLIANAHSRALFEGMDFRFLAPLPELFRDFPELMPEPVLMERRLLGGL